LPWQIVRVSKHFFDQNRTGYPGVNTKNPLTKDVDKYTITPTNVTGDLLPRRLLFPDAEVKSNPNTPAQVPLTTEVWWGK